MPTTQFPRIPSPPNKPDLSGLSKYVEQLANLLAVLSKELDFLLNGSLDVQNIRAHSITADTLNVDELSAITANLGTITAGIINGIQIFGSYIATSDGTYPRAEMSAADNLFGAYLDANNFFEIQPSDPGTGAPTLNWVAGGSTAFQQYTDASETRFRAIARDLILSTLTSGNIVLEPEVGSSVVLPSLFSTLLANTGLTLQDSFDTKATKAASTGSAGSASLNGGIPVGTVLMVSGGGTVTWGGINVPNHTHTQT